MSLFAGATLALTGIAHVHAQAKHDFVPGRILVKPKDHVSQEAVEGIFAAKGVKVKNTIGQLKVHVLHVPEHRMAEALDELQHDPSIEFAEPDWVIPSAMVPNDQFYMYDMEWHPAKIGALSAWDLTTGSPEVIIAILDTGIDSTHPDLAPNIISGWNICDGNADTSDVQGHGTVVAGVACGQGNNGIGIAPLSWGCRIMPVRVGDAYGWSTASLIANGLVYAADHGARVANVSFEANVGMTVMSGQQYFFSKGGVVTVAAGNNSQFETAADSPYALTVTATDSNDLLASFSNTGNNVDLAAPGVSIMSTATGNRYAAGTGTSASAPIVAGIAALMFSVNPALTPTDVQNILKGTAEDLGTPGWDTSFGWGRVNAYRAVLAAVSALPTTADTTIPVTAVDSPGSGSGLAGTVSVNVLALDDVGITRIELYLDGVLTSSAAKAPANFSWDTTKSANGSHTLQSKAYDAAGNVGVSTINTVTVQNMTRDSIAPAVSVNSPASSATISGTVNVNLSATDNVGVTKVEWYLDSSLAGSSSAPSASFSWDTLKNSNGSHVLTAKAYDLAGNVGVSSTVSVTIDNVVPGKPPTPADLVAPSVQITSPATGSTIGGKNNSIRVSVTASDNVAITRVDFFVDGKLQQSSTSSSPTFTWSTSKVAKGSHNLQAFAYDAAGNKGTSSIVTVTK